jgi:hypothetical protein
MYDAPSLEVVPQERQRMVPQRQADVAVILDDLTAGRHRPQRHRRLADLGDRALLARRRRREQFGRLIAQRLDRPYASRRANPRDSRMPSASEVITRDATDTPARRHG